MVSNLMVTEKNYGIKYDDKRENHISYWEYHSIKS